MHIGIIGAGGMGSCLASKLTKLGHTVSIANSRGPSSLQQLAEDAGAKAATVEEVADKELIIVSIPQKNIPDLAKRMHVREGAIVIDTGNYYPNLRDGTIPALEQSGIDSMWVQGQLGVPIVKVFNSILAESLRDMSQPKGGKDRIALAVSGDDVKAKEVVCKLVEELGFDPFDAGDIAQSWKQQPGSPVYCRDIHLEELKRRVNAMGDWSVMHDVIIAQRIADEKLMKADYPAYLKTLLDPS